MMVWPKPKIHKLDPDSEVWDSNRQVRNTYRFRVKHIRYRYMYLLAVHLKF
jgi:hypothetical protein